MYIHFWWCETCRVIQQQFWVKECDILGVKTYSDPSYIFSWESGPRNPRMYAPANTYTQHNKRLTVSVAFWLYVCTAQKAEIRSVQSKWSTLGPVSCCEWHSAHESLLVWLGLSRHALERSFGCKDDALIGPLHCAPLSTDGRCLLTRNIVIAAPSFV